MKSLEKSGDFFSYLSKLSRVSMFSLCMLKGADWQSTVLKILHFGDASQSHKRHCAVCIEWNVWGKVVVTYT